MDRLKEQLGIKIKSIRIAKGLTQEAFCDKIGLEIPTLSNIENGKSIPSTLTLIKIQKVFKLEPNEFWNFIDWEETIKNPIDIEIQEYITSLPDDIKQYILELIKRLK